MSDEPPRPAGHGRVEPAAAASFVRRTSVVWLLLCGTALVVAVLLGTGFMTLSSRERILANDARELENTALLLARHFDQQLKDHKLVQQSLAGYMGLAGIATKADYNRRMSTEAMHVMLESWTGDASSFGNLTLLDADGVVINWSSTWPAPAVDLSDRAFFTKLKSSSDADAETVEPVYGRMTGQWTTVIARKLNGPDGEFLGVLARGLEPAQFEKFFSATALGPGGAIAIYHLDGTLLAHYPPMPAMIGRKFSDSPLFREIILRSPQGTKRLLSHVAGEDRIISARRLERLPLAIVTSVSVPAALADWRRENQSRIGIAALAVVGIVAIFWLTIRHLSREHAAARRTLALEKQRLDIAVDNMTQGLVVFDDAERVVVCNQRYIEIYGLSPEFVRPGRSLRELIAHRKETGSIKMGVEERRAVMLDNIRRGKVARSISETRDGRFIQTVTQPLADGGWVSTHEDITERKRSDERIAHLAYYDTLTELPNRTLFREQLDKDLDRARCGEQLAVLYIDIDEFKTVNDSLGHTVGDELLKAVADRLGRCVRSGDMVARLGGDEFAIVQTAIHEPGDVTELVTRVHQAIREPFDCLGHHLTVDASIGVALAPDDGVVLEQLLRHADLAMYAAKAGGRRTCRFFEPQMDARVKARRTLEIDLRQALAEQQFELHYQPLVRLADNAVSGCEALLRWRHPRRGDVSPMEFIPVAEDTGLINQLGDWALRTACFEAASWPDDLKVAVNVSPVQFKSQTFPLKVASALAASGLAARRLELEITEAVLIEDDEAALATLHRLRELGVRIALDDFGTGYSSLSYLQRFPFDKIKIDRAFIRNVVDVAGSRSIVRAVVSIASDSHMTTTAEGVETEAQRALLSELGCTEMQGYLFSPARPAAEVVRLFSAGAGGKGAADKNARDKSAGDKSAAAG